MYPEREKIAKKREQKRMYIDIIYGVRENFKKQFKIRGHQLVDVFFAFMRLFFSFVNSILYKKELEKVLIKSDEFCRDGTIVRKKDPWNVVGRII